MVNFLTITRSISDSLQYVGLSRTIQHTSV